MDTEVTTTLFEEDVAILIEALREAEEVFDSQEAQRCFALARRLENADSIDCMVDIREYLNGDHRALDFSAILEAYASDFDVDPDAIERVERAIRSWACD